MGKNHKKLLNNLEEFRKSAGLTQQELSESAEVSRKSINAIENGLFKKDIIPYDLTDIFLDENEQKQKKTISFDTDEGPRKDTTIEKLSKLRPVFSKNGTVTAGNSSQTSDGAAFILLMSERMVKKLNVNPIAKMISYAVSGVEPKHMGIGPVEAIPKALKQANLHINDIELIELNEAFACQSLAVIRESKLNPEIINVNGGAIALGHPLGCTGAKLTVQLLNEMKRRKQKIGMVTMCVGTGQGAAGIFELLN